MSQIRFSPHGHVFDSDDGITPRLSEYDDPHEYAQCELCYRSVCIYEGGVQELFAEDCKYYTQELPGMEIPVVDPPTGRHWGERKQ